MVALTMQNDDFNEVIQARNAVLSKLVGKKRPKVVGLDREGAELKSLLTGAIVHKERNSCIIMGPRSAGKTTLVQSVIGDLKSEHGDSSFLVINLSGYAQSDDKMAIREIARQLDVQIGGGEDSDVLEKKRINDTLMALLNVFDQDDDDEQMQDESSHALTVVFVLDEIDRFAASPKQTLLYTLLDIISQSSSHCIAVVGLTTRMNIREMLEKRVRSRFSQRIFSIKRPISLENFWQICRANLILDYESEFAASWNTAIDVSGAHAAASNYMVR